MTDEHKALTRRLRKLADMVEGGKCPSFLIAHYVISVVVPSAARICGTQAMATELNNQILRALNLHLGTCTICCKSPAAADGVCPKCEAKVAEFAADVDADDDPDELTPPATAQRISRQLANAGIEMTPAEVSESNLTAWTKIRDNCRAAGMNPPESLPAVRDWVCKMHAPVRDAARHLVREYHKNGGVAHPGFAACKPTLEVFVCVTCGNPREGDKQAALFRPNILAHSYPICRTCVDNPPK